MLVKQRRDENTGPADNSVGKRPREFLSPTSGLVKKSEQAY